MVHVMKENGRSYINNSDNNINSIYSINNLSILNIQEEERQRIAMELHDTSLQTLAHVIHQVDLAGI